MLIYVGININDLTTLYITVIVNELNHIVKCSQYILWYLRQPKIDCYAYMFSCFICISKQWFVKSVSQNPALCIHSSLNNLTAPSLPECANIKKNFSIQWLTYTDIHFDICILSYVAVCFNCESSFWVVYWLCASNDAGDCNWRQCFMFTKV